jgi:hypothetical protein
MLRKKPPFARAADIAEQAFFEGKKGQSQTTVSLQHG